MNMDLKSEKNVTSSDIARAAGVSVGTVSNVLNNTAVVKEDLRQKVLKTVKELHYVQNYTAKSLASKNNHHIGVAVYEMSNPYHVEVVRGIEEYATQNGYIVSIFMLDNNMDKKLDAVCQRKLSGLVNFMTNEYPATFLDILRKQGTLLVNFGTEQGIRAYVDYADAIKEYCRTLYTLGHRDIGYLYYGDRPRFLADNRGRAFYEARKELGLTENDDYILFGNNSSENSEVLGYESVKRLMRAHPEVTALFCTNDMAAVGAMRGLREMGLRVPEDVSVIGCDDIWLAEFFSPSLSSISHDKREMGRRIAKAIIDSIREKTISEDVIWFQAKAVMRDSLGRARSVR